MKEYILTVEEGKGEQRFDVFLSNETGVSRSRAKELIEFGCAYINGREIIKASYLTKVGDEVRALVEEDIELDAKAEDIPIDIIYQDQDLAVINKAQGMVTHPAVGNFNGTLVNAIMYHIKDLSSINGVIRPGIVHRLDKDTSGLIMIAKNDLAHRCLAEQIATKEAKRYYIALVDGNIKEDSGQIDASIARSQKDRIKMTVDDKGRKALTYYEVAQRYKQYTLVKFELKTGRTHQIRVHSKYINHPIVGDALYGGSNKFGLKGQLLHAYRLVLRHPTSGEILDFTADLPDFFKDVLNKIDHLKE